MENLTKPQSRMLQAIIDGLFANGRPPSIRELCTATGIASLRGVTGHLKALERKGYIIRGAARASDIKVLKTVSGRRVRLAFEDEPE